MKPFVTLFFFLLLTTTAFAQNAAKIEKVETFSNGVALEIQISSSVEVEQEVARLYRYKNSRVKKALRFRTKRNTSKFA